MFKSIQKINFPLRGKVQYNFSIIRSSSDVEAFLCASPGLPCANFLPVQLSLKCSLVIHPQQLHWNFNKNAVNTNFYYTYIICLKDFYRFGQVLSCALKMGKNKLKDKCSMCMTKAWHEFHSSSLSVNFTQRCFVCENN